MAGGPLDEWEDGEGGDVPFVPPELHEAWRGEVHLEHWPEDLAGPEYRMFRDAADEDDEEGQ